MNPFLKKEWEDTRIPRIVYEQARQGAWSRLERRLPAARRWVLPLAAAALVSGLLLLRPGPAPLTAPPPLPLPSLGRAPLVPPLHARLESHPKPDGEATTGSRVSHTQVPALPRVVLRMRLPSSGVRMIWIMKQDFPIRGGGE